MNPGPTRVSRAAALGLVFLGGAAGSGLREAISQALPDSPRVATLAVNTLGAFLLGALLEALGSPGAREGGRRRAARLLLGTGFCGGFTTYSAIAVQGAELLRGGDAVTAVAYAVITLLVGALATMAGIALGGRVPGGARGGARGRSRGGAPAAPGADS